MAAEDPGVVAPQDHRLAGAEPLDDVRRVRGDDRLPHVRRDEVDQAQCQIERLAGVDFSTAFPPTNRLCESSCTVPDRTPRKLVIDTR